MKGAGAPPSARLLSHVDVSAYGCENMAMGDLDGDGRPEFVFVQGPGSLGCDLYAPGTATGWCVNHTTAEDQALDCVTAVSPEGRVLWQRGEPWTRPYPFRTHGNANEVLVADADGDGLAEVLRIRRGRLEALSGATGRTLRSMALDSDRYSQLLTARFKRGGGMQLIVKPVGAGLEGHPHACPVHVYDERLRRLWSLDRLHGAGHKPLPYDVDGDGRDELLIGWHLVGPDGSVRWTLPMETGVEKDHPDRRTVTDVDADGEPEQVLALEALGLVVTDLAGRVKWRRASGHCGEACVGRFYGDRPGMQILCNDEEPRDKGLPGAAMVDGRDGAVIWEQREDLYGITVDWPNELGPQAILAWRHEYYDDPEDARPFVMDGSRRVLATFDISRRLPSYKDYALPQGHLWRGDWGDYYNLACRKLDGADDSIIIWSRTDLWVFEARATGPA